MNNWVVWVTFPMNRFKILLPNDFWNRFLCWILLLLMILFQILSWFVFNMTFTEMKGLDPAATARCSRSAPTYGKCRNPDARVAHRNWFATHGKNVVYIYIYYNNIAIYIYNIYIYYINITIYIYTHFTIYIHILYVVLKLSKWEDIQYFLWVTLEVLVCCT